MINITTNITAIVTGKAENGVDVQVAFLNANLDTTSQNVNVSMTVSNMTLLQSNAVTVKTQYEAFQAAVKDRAIELGFVIYV